MLRKVFVVGGAALVVIAVAGLGIAAGVGAFDSNSAAPA